ncbi:ECF transporter S component [Nicoliella spurrieriana]|uniref:ECF transporter S component n=1 Tax=Nicoliella spurrieriana TaxID=2925830 RepID=A0A976RRF6_9LACO|nr:ECF transporter S component [Nicoliella spurrieriana]UQS86380.1 ECF transporter S component [Nicoliella spurrieriana]
MNRNYHLVARSIFIALILIQTTIPGLGYIPFGPLSLTIIPVTVILAAVLLGTTDGMLIGGIWGIITFIRAFFWPTSPLAQYVFINPLVSILPRILIGLVAGVIFNRIIRYNHRKAWLAIVGGLGSLTNTIFLLGMIYVFYHGYAHELYHINVKALLPYLLTVLATNGLLEALIAAGLTPLIATPLLKFTKK